MQTDDNSINMSDLPLTFNAIMYLMKLSEHGELNADEMQMFIETNSYVSVLEAYHCLDVSEHITKYIEDGHLYNRMALYKLCPDMYKATIIETQLRKQIAQDEDTSLFHGLIHLTDSMCQSVCYAPLHGSRNLKQKLFWQWPHNSSDSRVMWLRSPHEVIKQLLALGNVIVAGGYALSMVSNKVTSAGDIDIFIYGLNENHANAKLRAISKILKGDSFYTGNAYTFVNTDVDNMNVQVILRLYKSPAEVLLGFDIQACKVLIVMEDNILKYYATPSFIESMRYNCIWVDTERQSSSYAIRLIKYYAKGLDVIVTGLNRRQLDCEIMSMPLSKLNGLALLMRLEREIRSINHGESSMCKYLMMNHLKRIVQRAKLHQSDYHHAVSFKDKLYEVLIYAWTYSKRSLKQLGWFKITRSNVWNPVTWQTSDPSSQTVNGNFHPEDIKYYHMAYSIENVSEFR
jgi:hypothetical protein